ncbi:hypothetical protein ANCDUO_24383, partial [Ancylostoma duodenale]
MPPKSNRSTKVSSKRLANSNSANPVQPTANADEEEYRRMSSTELIGVIMSSNTDHMYNLLKWSRLKREAVVLAGLEEAPADLSPKLRLKDLESKVENVLDSLQIECRPSEFYLMG